MKTLNNKHKNISKNFLKYFGINLNTARQLSKYFGLAPRGKTSDLLEIEIKNIEIFIRKNLILNDHLKLLIIDNIKKEIKLKTFKGFAHKFKTPLNGQRSKQNARTIKRMVPLTIAKGYNSDKFLLLDE